MGQGRIDRRPVVKLLAAGLAVDEGEAVALVSAPRRREVVGEWREVVADVNAAGSDLQERRIAVDVRELAGQHRIVPMFDLLRDQRRRPARRRAAAEPVVVPPDVEIVAPADTDRSLRERLVAVPALLVEVRVDADARSQPAIERKNAVEPDAVPPDRPTELERALLVVVNLVRELLGGRIVADEARRNDVEAADAVEAIAPGLGHDVDDAALEAVELR